MINFIVDICEECGADPATCEHDELGKVCTTCLLDWVEGYTNKDIHTLLTNHGWDRQ